MRDSIIGFTLIAAIIAGFLYLKHTGGLSSSIDPSSDGKLAQTTTPGTTSKAMVRKSIRTKQGDSLHERTNHSHIAQNQRDGESEGIADDIAEIESLTSIYQGQRISRSPKPKTHAGTAVAAASPRLASRKVVYGVPVDIWVTSQAHSLAGPGAPGPDDMSMRVFFQCMELKKNENRMLGQRECRSLVDTRPGDKVARGATTGFY